ncbi:MAG: riboflavin biosynthesis protein RibF [Eubacteriales bacterium]|nr:riboflavin biosynthesis protein RibF [Eubacteriales bacterium]
MQIISNTTEFQIEEPTAVAIGKFDGVHLGHRKLLAALERKKKEGLRSTVFTFDPSPAIFFSGGKGAELTVQAEKRVLFERLGVDILVEFPLNAQTAATPPENFVREILAGRLHAEFLAAGSDLSFGDKGAGDFALVRRLADSCGYTSRTIRKVRVGDEIVSSTKIRSYVEAGQMEEAAAMLAEPYFFLGEIVHGNEIGRTLEIPTINQRPAEHKLLPPFGVYYSRVEIDGKEYAGMTNIGIKPTVQRSGEGESSPVTVETYLYDFRGDLYGRTARTCLLTFRRPERRFSGLEELRETMARDVAAGREYHRIK